MNSCNFFESDGDLVLGSPIVLTYQLSVFFFELSYYFMNTKLQNFDQTFNVSTLCLIRQDKDEIESNLNEKSRLRIELLFAVLKSKRFTPFMIYIFSLSRKISSNELNLIEEAENNFFDFCYQAFTSCVQFQNYTLSNYESEKQKFVDNPDTYLNLKLNKNITKDEILIAPSWNRDQKNFINEN